MRMEAAGAKVDEYRIIQWKLYVCWQDFAGRYQEVGMVRAFLLDNVEIWFAGSFMKAYEDCGIGSYQGGGTIWKLIFNEH